MAIGKAQIIRGVPRCQSESHRDQTRTGKRAPRESLGSRPEETSPLRLSERDRDEGYASRAS